MSNMSLVKKHKYLYGLTGTLGYEN